MVITENTEKINELIEKINSLPNATSGSSGVDGKDGFSPTISVEQVDGGHNIIITDINGTQSFFVPDGKDGAPGSGESASTGIVSIEQTTTSTESGGTNIITATLSDGQTSTFNIKNGERGDGGNDGVSVTSIKQTTTSTANGGTNIITATLSNGQTSTFNIKNGTKGGTGATGADGVSVVSVTQTTTSTDDDGENVITVTLSNGNVSTFKIKNGSKGSDGADGASANINGVNTLTLKTSGGITKSQSGSTMTIGASLTDILASGPIILKQGIDYHYGDTLPASGTEGRLFFLKKS